MHTLLVILHLVSAIVLIGVVLLQAGKGGGLSGAFGSGMGSETLFGARTGDVLTRATAIMATIFITSSLALAYLSVKHGSSVSEKIRKEEQQKSVDEERTRQFQELLKTKMAEEAAKKAPTEPALPSARPAPNTTGNIPKPSAPAPTPSQPTPQPEPQPAQ